ncbi:MAG: 4Fe-4S dicluster domain-containing protein [Campylobacteraceae bacterium]|jgi:ferredoxin-type protein NapG|nr:4Fe-4S dicluster domain-containing protein [Campylobacteraceae bacterium]MBT3883027.1 4Fe-4S dicluster domain-containing protein [Campylobacteraceae bacterium]MBT4030687.1 4Fe-4S dicluster domain-containing protein [Campylobacteraceae bacterium]MBT4179362.1 4Fe-4S dicluster domain-containing protein [Campylobacteraceae bacterium]MBT4572658.1 4Fe-4S dicluster domain-containing protein [Campylobacteraceae bacterium]
MAKIKTERRDFVKYSTLGILGLAAASGIALSSSGAIAENRLRPPGAVDEKEFLALCIKCGQCLQVCPYHSIELADFGKGHGVGTPYIDANIRGCYACDAVPCVLACPSGALDHHTEKATDIKMGIAVLESPKTCLAVTRTPVPAGYDEKMKDFIANVTNVNPLEDKILEKFDGYEGKDCTLCADMCPMPNPLSAIAMVKKSSGITRPEIYEGCTGCGVCQEVCPVSEPAIVIKPRLSYEDYYIKGKRS